MFHVKHADFDVAVIGAGHAGCEAAHAAARLGCRVALITPGRDTIGVMSCNPAIGGLGKGHLVREIDALDGLMGRVADRSGIQFRLLNRRKGAAVQGPRAQADRTLYRQAMQQEVEGTPNIALIYARVSDLLMERDAVAGVILDDGSELRAFSTVLTTGTFLRGVIHIGDQQRPGGRMGEKATVGLAERIDGLGLPLGRLKTGTPPRLNGRTIDWAAVGSQPGDDDPVFFSFLTRRVEARQIACGVTETNERTHDIIRSNLERSAMYGGHIDGVGPRYCPSIEDKVVRFAEKTSHQIFLEPEGLADDTVYPNGISTSLPIDVQEDYVRSIKGLERVEIRQPGYAIEYDYVDPRALDPGLRVVDVPGLYLAGQINGTTGYEEAGAQGIVAGLNAALAARGRVPEYFDRATSYIGVMIDDLVTRGVAEPYRMFTSRAEFRLSLRADNADQRLTPTGIRLGLVGDERACGFRRKAEALEAGRVQLRSSSWTGREARAVGIDIAADGPRRSSYELLGIANVDAVDVAHLDPVLADLDPVVRQQLIIDAKYAPYAERQARDVEVLRRDAAVEIPADFDFAQVGGLSYEIRQKLAQVRPADLGQANRIEGMTPAALTAILAALRQTARKRA